MSTTDTDAVATIDQVLAEGDEGHDMVETEDVVTAEVVSDVVESGDEVTAEEAPKPRRGRKPKSQQEGEVREVAAPEPTQEKPALTLRKAQALTEKIKTAAANSSDLFIQAWNNRIWLSYGDQFKTGKGSAHDFLEWIKVELAEDRPRLPKAKRLELVASIKTEGRVSQSVVAEIVGLDQKTVSNDLRDAESQGVEVDRTSVGADGKTYTRSRGASGREKSFGDKLDAFVKMAYNGLEKLQELRVEDEWDTSARAWRQDFARLSSEFAALRDTLEETEEFEQGDDPEE